MRFLSVSMLFVLFIAAHLQGADDAQLTALRAADEERVAVTLAPDRARLDAIFSDDLHYAHSTGAVDTKKSYVEMLLSGKSKYVSYDYVAREFTFPAPGVALMRGRVHVKNISAASGTTDGVLSFLGVWREENGKWRFLAWQSCRLPAEKAPAK